MVAVINETQEKIIDAYLLLAKECPNPQKITIEMIATKAHIRRQNIYKKHFTSKEDIIKKARLLVDARILEKITAYKEKEGDDLISFIAKDILPLLYANHDRLKILYSSQADPAWINFLTEQYAPFIAYYIDLTGNQTGFSTDFLSQFFMRQILDILAHWLTKEVPENPLDFQDKFIALFSISAYTQLKKSS